MTKKNRYLGIIQTERHQLTYGTLIAAKFEILYNKPLLQGAGRHEANGDVPLREDEELHVLILSQTVSTGGFFLRGAGNCQCPCNNDGSGFGSISDIGSRDSCEFCIGNHYSN